MSVINAHSPVGGDPLGTGETDVLLHYDGSAWTQVAALVLNLSETITRH